ncbi:hypothetical protein V1279_005711 [Bradyrhizobium sp. AZCC 1610]|uniref:hypothetical protein n=1 Tax=Bradyrhizobium sp. AZCC 1610 TaxID=3117020 RepID=UPI002FEFF417
MTALLDLVLESHGTLERWRKFNAIDVNLSMHGEHWKRKGWDGVFKNVQLKVQTKEQRTCYTHFTEEGVQSIYEPDRVRLETIDGKLIEERVHPRKAFEGHTLQTTWDRLHLAYFSGYAIWNYLNTPFMFVTESAKAEEIDPWTDQGTVRRRLKITFPEKVGTHCPEQIFHVDENGLIARLDYTTLVAGGAPAAHYMSEYKNIQGIMMPTKRRAFRRNPDETLNTESVLVGIDISAITLT